MEDDNRSVASAGSVASTSQEKVPCPHCAKDFQKRAIFKHIRLNHYQEFLSRFSESWIAEAERGEPLRVNWEGENDHGEPAYVTIWVCLATYKTFLSRPRASAHLAKDHSARNIHNRELTKLKKHLQSAEFKRQQEKNNNPVIKSYKLALETNCPELARIFWRRILFTNNGIIMMRELIKSIEFEEDKNLNCKLELFDKKYPEIELLKSAKCLDVKTLISYYDSFQNISTYIYSKFETFEKFAIFLSFGDYPIKVKHSDFSEEMYFLANENMPSVEF